MAVTPHATSPLVRPAWRRNLRESVTTIGIWVAIVVVIWTNWKPAPPIPANLPREPVALEPITLQGNPHAPLTLLVFSDYQCPYCARFARETEPLVEERYIKRGRTRLGYRHLPIDKIHPLARGAAVAVECAGRQNQFWPMHRRLFEHPDQLDAGALVRHAQALGIDGEAFQACLSDETVAARVEDDLNIARAFRITGTPALLVARTEPDGKVQYVAALRGAVGIDELAEVLDAELWRAWFARHRWLLATGAAIACASLLLLRWRRRLRPA